MRLELREREQLAKKPRRKRRRRRRKEGEEEELWITTCILSPTPQVSSRYM